MKRPVIAITMGDPSGIGPEVIVKALELGNLQKICRPLVIGDLSILSSYGWKNSLGEIISLTSLEGQKRSPAVCGEAAVRYIRSAAGLALGGQVQGLATAPVSKEAIQKAGLSFVGHTEFLQELTKARSASMMMTAGDLRAVMVTRHLPLSRVSSALSSQTILESASLLHNALKRYFGCARPRLVVCGLNPHAGENGLLGEEEKQVIGPSVKKLVARGFQAEGPVPADAAFAALSKKKYDGAVAMYHDQVMIPLKTLDGSHLVNVTLGLPFVRTSPGHGTAFDIAGRHKADPTPMWEAIRLAAEMASR